jgi:mRNA interferase RelE/StbE
MFRVVAHKKALREIESLSSRDRIRVLKAIKEMESDPFLGDIKPLKPVKSLFRKRIGDFRIVFTLNFELSEVIIFRVGRRERVYEKI